MHEIMFESWFQASLQVISMIEYGLDDSKVSRIFSLAISCLSILYGLSTYNLRLILSHLRREPNIKTTFCFTLMELSSSAVMFLYLPCVYLISWKLMVNDETAYKVLAFVLLCGISVFSPQLSSQKLNFRIIDYRTNLYSKFHDNLEDVISRRRLVVVNIIFVLGSNSAVTIALYCINQNPLCIIPSFGCKNKVSDEHFRSMVAIMAWYTASFISFLQNVLELFLIKISNITFLGWVFKAALEKLERVNRCKMHMEMKDRHKGLEVGTIPINIFTAKLCNNEDVIVHIENEGLNEVNPHDEKSGLIKPEVNLEEIFIDGTSERILLREDNIQVEVDIITLQLHEALHIPPDKREEDILFNEEVNDLNETSALTIAEGIVDDILELVELESSEKKNHETNWMERDVGCSSESVLIRADGDEVRGSAIPVQLYEASVKIDLT